MSSLPWVLSKTHFRRKKKLKSGFWCHLRKIGPSRECIYCEFHYVVLLFLFSIPWDNMKIAHEDLMSEAAKQEVCAKTPYVCFLILLWKCKRKKTKQPNTEEVKER